MGGTLAIDTVIGLITNLVDSVPIYNLQPGKQITSVFNDVIITTIKNIPLLSRGIYYYYFTSFEKNSNKFVL